MQCLEYPFDPEEILSKKKKIKRELLNDGSDRIKKNIAILGGYTTADIKQVMEIFLLHHGIDPLFYESDYNQYYQDAMFPNEVLEQFSPDIIYFCTSNRNIINYPKIADSAEKVDALIENEINKYMQMWERVRDVYHCPVIQNNFEMPFYRLMGNRDASDIHGAVNFLTRLNMKFYEYAQTHTDFYICDINYISADYGLKEWSDPLFWHMYKYAVNVNAIPYLSFNVANIIKSIFGKNKKGFVLDLDNTLWGGVIGDDGIEGIKLGPEESIGQVYSEFQRYIKAHKQLGVILAINSKNEEQNAAAGLNHPYSEFQIDDFVEIKANWEPKDKNFRQIADNLHILPESLVFIDDNPAERHIVTAMNKGVSAPEINEVEHYIYNIDRSGYFEVTSISADDFQRTEMYRKNAERAKAKIEFTDYHEYLLSLDMKAVIRPFESVYITRIAQLTNKSNQFNLTTKRYTKAEIEEKAKDSNYITLYGKLIDRFGDNGVVSIVIGHIKGEECHIDLWLMSCRVLKRDMEYAMMDRFVELCKSVGICTIFGYYFPTKKNAMVSDFYALQDFRKISESFDGSSKWQYDIPDIYRQKTDVIKILESED